MKLYRIRNWNDLFENSRSRVVVELSWVPVPNHHDGENFSIIMSHPDGAVIFAGWILLLQVASKCTPRGTLIRGNGQPHTVTTLSSKCRCPVTWFEISLKYLEENTDWIDAVEVKGGYHPGVTQVTVDRHPSAEERRKEEKERREENGAPTDSETPSWEEFFEYCKIHGGPVEWYARDKFLAAQASSWKGKERWTFYADRCRLWWETDGRPMFPPKLKNHAKQEETLVDKELKAFEKL